MPKDPPRPVTPPQAPLTPDELARSPGRDAMDQPVRPVLTDRGRKVTTRGWSKSIPWGNR